MHHTDKIHAKFVNENRLSPLTTRHQTESVFTYFSETDTINASRIDDAYYFLLNNNNTRALPPPSPVKEATENITLSDSNSDHRPLVHTIPKNSSLCLPRYDNNENENPNNINNKAEPKMRFQKVENKQTARITLLADHSSLAHKTRENTCKAVEIAMQALDGNHSPQNRVAAQRTLQEAGLSIDDLAEEVIGAINTCHQSIIEKQIWERTPTNPKGKGLHAPRKISGETQKFATSKKATQTAMTHMIHAKAKATLYAKNITTDTPTNTQDNQTQDTQ